MRFSAVAQVAVVSIHLVAVVELLEPIGPVCAAEVAVQALQVVPLAVYANRVAVPSSVEDIPVQYDADVLK